MADPTTGDLFKAKTITDDEVNAAVDVFMKDPTVSLFRFASGHALDLAAAVKASNFATLVVADVHANASQKARAVRTVILLARPVQE